MTARTVTAQEAADALGMSKRAVNKAVTTKAGPCDVLPDGSRRFNLDELRKWFCEVGSIHNNGSNRAGIWASGGADDQTGMAEARRMLVVAQVRSLAISNGVRSGKLLDADEVFRKWMRQCYEVRTAIEAVPVKAAQQIAAAMQLPAEKIETVRALLDSEVREAMRRMSE